MRAKLFDAARLAAAAIGYAGAGTVEFLADDDGEFYFLEMNTRLQVEHPVTEETTGLDLVELQLMVAEGGRLDAAPPVSQGHSIEARLYAEDPAHGWQPQAGVVHTFEVPSVRAEFSSLGQRTGIRLDTGLDPKSAGGFTVSIHYDPMLAKVISYAPTRRQSALVLADALARARLHGLRTNRDLLVNVLRHPAFLDGATDTAFFDTHGLAELSAPLADDAVVRLSAIAAALADAAHNRALATVFGSIPSGWRNVPSGNQVKGYLDDGGNEQRIEYRFARSGLALPDDESVRLVAATADEVVLADGGVDCSFAVTRYGSPDNQDVYVDSPRGPVHLTAQPRFPEPGSAVEKGSLIAPMPGNVVRLGAQVGDAVTAGQPLVWLEAMKMEHTVAAPTDGLVVELNVNTGQQVEVGAVLARVEPPQAEGDPQ
jgi:propionyl-CoA carboxylase alpha chain